MGLDRDKSIDVMHHAGIDDTRDGAWVVHGRGIETRISPIGLSKKFHELHGNFGNRGVQPSDALENVWGGKRLVREVQANHRKWPPRRKNDVCCFRVNGDIEFGSWRRIASRVGTAHENYFLDFLDDPRLFANSHGNIRQRRGWHQCDVT